MPNYHRKRHRKQSVVYFIWRHLECSEYMTAENNICFQMTVYQICLGYLYFSHCRYVRKFHGERMPSDSGIVPDIEVDEDFQDESKTFNELKSKPLKNRSIQMFTTYCLPWSWMSMMMIHL